jgi:phospholipid/cholesterol/gamma-HCH transport system ATP-binding protein
MSQSSRETPAIEFRNVSVSFDTVPALVDVSFKLEKGEMIFLTGVSGSGKSVLLRSAIGLIKPDEGQILIDGREIQLLDEEELIAVRGGLMGIVFQEDSLFTGLSVYENVAFRLDEHGWPQDRIEPAVAEVLSFVGLAGEEEKLPEELSGGMKRRLEIARALIGWPSIMLFDEPTMSLDPIVAVQVLDLIIRTRDLNRTSSLYVTKKLYEIPYLANYRAIETDDESKTANTGSKSESGEKGRRVVIVEASPEQLPRTRVMLLDGGRIDFLGSVADFQKSEKTAVRELLTLDRHDHSRDPYFSNPWDRSRHPEERIL